MGPFSSLRECFSLSLFLSLSQQTHKLCLRQPLKPKPSNFIPSLSVALSFILSLYIFLRCFISTASKKQAPTVDYHILQQDLFSSHPLSLTHTFILMKHTRAFLPRTITYFETSSRFNQDLRLKILISFRLPK